MTEEEPPKVESDGRSEEDLRARLAEIEVAVEQHPALGTVQQMEEIDRAREWYLRNAAYLLLGMDDLNNGDTGLRLFMLGDGVPWDDDDEKDPLREFVVEIGRLWHNYVASAMTVVEHIRKLFEKQPADLEAEYKQKIKELIVPHDVVDFVHKSRQVAVHKGVITPGATMRFQRGKQWYEVDCRSDILLNRYKGFWTAGAKRYLIAHSPRVNLTQVVEEYAEVVDTFYEWFTDRFYEFWFPVLSEFEALAKEYRQIKDALDPGEPPPHDPSLGFADPRTALRPKPPPSRPRSKSKKRKRRKR